MVVVSIIFYLLYTTILTEILFCFDTFSFWTLTANPDGYRHQAALELAEEKELTPEGVRWSSVLYVLCATSTSTSHTYEYILQHLNLPAALLCILHGDWNISHGWNNQ